MLANWTPIFTNKHAEKSEEKLSPCKKDFRSNNHLLFKSSLSMTISREIEGNIFVLRSVRGWRFLWNYMDYLELY